MSDKNNNDDFEGREDEEPCRSCENESEDLIEFARAQIAREHMEEINKPKRETPINADDIVNLRIALETSFSLERFLAIV